jgi:flagellar motor switch protein FliN
MGPMETRSMDRQALDDQMRKGAAAASGAGEAFEEVDAAADAADGDGRRLRSDLLRGVHLKVRVELGRARMPLKEALQLAPGTVVDLEKLVDEAVDLYVNDLLIARGEVLVVNDCFCVRITEVLAHGALEEAP